MLYLLVALGIGLADFVRDEEPVRRQPDHYTGHVLAGDDAVGFLFDLRSMPAVVRFITYVLPARYYVALLQTIFWPAISGR